MKTVHNYGCFSAKMNPNQKRAIESHFTEIISTLEHYVDLFLTHLKENKIISFAERQVIEVRVTNQERLMLLLETLMVKDNGWSITISYLRDNSFEDLVKTLENSAAEKSGPTNSPFYLQSFLVDFKQDLANHFKFEYSLVQTGFGRAKEIEKVWVPLQIKAKTDIGFPQNRLCCNEVVKFLSEAKTPQVALIKGHPGIGKTTLLKQIAHDWATNNAQQFTLVMIVPLRHVGPTKNFVQLTADYYADKLELSEKEKAALLYWLDKLGTRLLICLDGIDEYGSLTESPFDSYFEGKIKEFNGLAHPLFTFHLLVTSRPYVCDQLNPHFASLNYEILPLDKSHLADFVKVYCQTEDGAARVNRYLNRAESTIQVPLILMFICYLADLNKEISDNLTQLYSRFLFDMIKREVMAKTDSESINCDRWKEWEVIKSTARLAFDGCKSGKFEFSLTTQNEESEFRASFLCGVLLHKFDFTQKCLNAEFPHRSIQDFFAALYCYHLISTGDMTERNSVMKEVLKEDSQLGRFFLGICSDGKKFQEMLEWLNPTFSDSETISFNPGVLLSLLSASLSDCSEADATLLGQILAASLDHLETKIKTERNFTTNLFEIRDLSSLKKSFRSGLKLNFIDEKQYSSWCISHVDKPKLSRLTYVVNDLQVNLREKFDKIQIFMWNWNPPNLAGLISSLSLVPSVSTLIVHFGFPQFEVNFDLNYEMPTMTSRTSTTSQLQRFTFGFLPATSVISSWKDLFSGQPENNDLVIREMSKTGEHEEISWLTVTVRRTLKLQELVRELIRVAVATAIPPNSDEAQSSSNCMLS